MTHTPPTIPAVDTPDYKNPQRTAAQRAQDLLTRMTLPEKIAQLHGHWLVLDAQGNHRVRPGPAFLGSSDPETLKERLSLGVGHITRPLGTHSVDAAQGLAALNRLQHYLVHETRLGIPALAHEECLVGLMTKDGTLFPSALALSSSWNPDLVKAVAHATGVECRAVGCHQGLAPVLDVSRDVRWGRTEETFGEDPYLVGVLGVAYVEGLQGPQRDVLATLKHFAGHSFSEGARNHAPVNVGWRTLNDTFLLPFEMAIKLAHAGSVMPAYHDIDGEPCHASHTLLQSLLRDQWGFDGLVVADYGGVSLLYQHHAVAQDAMEAAAMAYNAGMDVELPGDDGAKHLEAAIHAGLVSLQTINNAVSRVLEQKFKLGLFERTYETPVSPPALRTQEAIATASEAARQSIVVLHNRSDILPLTPHTRQTIALIGPTANDPLALMSAYSYPAHVVMHNEIGATDHIVTPLAAFRQLYGTAQTTYAQGCHIIEKRQAGAPVFPGDLGANPTLQHPPVSTNTDQIAEAVEQAKRSDVALVFVGDLAGMFQTGTVGEGSDTDSLRLPGVQQELLEAVVATGTPTIAVLMSGRPYQLGAVEQQLAAYVMAFAGGQQGGLAIAEVVLGHVPPSGRLTVSVPKSGGAMPYHYNHKLKSAGTPVAFHFGSNYPFGHGQALTSFAYQNLVVSEAHATVEGEFVLSFELTNTGSRDGVEVPQLYVRDRHSGVVRPLLELKAFARVPLAAGASCQVTWVVPVDMLGHTGLAGDRVVEPGWFDMAIGASSADLRLRTSVEVCGAVRKLPQQWRMTSTTTLHHI